MAYRTQFLEKRDRLDPEKDKVRTWFTELVTDQIKGQVKFLGLGGPNLDYERNFLVPACKVEPMIISVEKDRRYYEQALKNRDQNWIVWHGDINQALNPFARKHSRIGLPTNLNAVWLDYCGTLPTACLGLINLARYLTTPKVCIAVTITNGRDGIRQSRVLDSARLRVSELSNTIDEGGTYQCGPLTYHTYNRGPQTTSMLTAWGVMTRI